MPMAAAAIIFRKRSMVSASLRKNKKPNKKPRRGAGVQAGLQAIVNRRS
jgi:hypothetical protein